MKRTTHIQAVAWLLTAIIFCGLLPGCGAQSDPATTAAQRFIQYWKAQDYASMHAIMTTPAKRRYTRQAIEEKFIPIYEDLGISQIDVELGDGKQTAQGMWFDIRVKYQTSEHGELSFDAALEMQQEGENWLVNWNLGVFFTGMEQMDDRVRVATLRAKRGEIFDQKSNLLAANHFAPIVYARIDKVENAQLLCDSLAPLVDMTPDEIRAVLEGKAAQRDGIALIKSYPVGELSEALRQSILDIQGVLIDEKTYMPIRYYPNSSLLFHTLGYVGIISEEEYEKYKDQGYKVDDQIGKAGLEAAYEDSLRGKNGWELAVYNADGRKLSTLASSPAVDGSDLIVTIDLDLQKRAETVMADNLPEGYAGAVICLNPKTGAVQAAVSAPTFDLNRFTFPISKEDWAILNAEDGDKPLFNRITQGLYPPGSTFKPFTAACGLTLGTLTPESRFPYEVTDERTWKPTNETWYFPAIRRTESYGGDNGLEDAIIYSDNIFFAWSALNIGEQSMIEYMENLGLGQRIEYDLPVAKSRYSNVEKSLQTRKLLADTGYGQGELLVSPMQMAAMFSAFANDGNIPCPFIVQETKRMEGLAHVTVETFEPKVWKSQVISSASVATLRPILEKVSEHGTGRLAKVPGVNIAAKTGTAEVGSDKEREIAWYIGFVSQGDYERLVCVALEVPASKGNIKFSIARELLQQ